MLRRNKLYYGKLTNVTKVLNGKIYKGKTVKMSTKKVQQKGGFCNKSATKRGVSATKVQQVSAEKR